MDCPHYIAPRYDVYTNPETGIEYDCETAAMCEIVDKYCIVEHGKDEDCDLYMEFLAKKEEE